MSSWTSGDDILQLLTDPLKCMVNIVQVCSTDNDRSCYVRASVFGLGPTIISSSTNDQQISYFVTYFIMWFLNNIVHA